MKVIVRPGGKKGMAPQQAPQKKKESFGELIGRSISIIKKDIQIRLRREPPVEKWEDYQRFCDLARGKR